MGDLNQTKAVAIELSNGCGGLLKYGRRENAGACREVVDGVRSGGHGRILWSSKQPESTLVSRAMARELPTG